MKGMELPINVIVVVVIALIVLIGVSSFFNSSLRSGENSMDAQQKWQTACSGLKMRGCQVQALIDMKIGKDETPATDLCQELSGTSDPVQCCQVCCGTGEGVCK